ncbi:MAG: DUF4184 family protein [Bacteroidetes bacterium]|nr:DUF4184 family protein [Bacteroidota bacterium]
MPFTFAHPAAILPFRFIPQKYYSWTGLIIGSMVPDFQAFFQLGGGKMLSHSWIGIFIYDLPVGLLLGFVFHLIVRDPLIDNLPQSFAERLVNYHRTNWVKVFQKRYGIILFSLLIGILSHIILDRITHTDTYSYSDRVGLKLSIEDKVEWSRILQRGGSIVGFALLLWQIRALPAARHFVPHRCRMYWFIVADVTFIIFWFRFQFPIIGDDDINSLLGAGIWGLIAAGILVEVSRKKQAKFTLTN